MLDKETIRELSDLLEQLRWTLSGARAGGVRDWARLPAGDVPAGDWQSETPAPISPTVLRSPDSGRFSETALRQPPSMERETDVPATAEPAPQPVDPSEVPGAVFVPVLEAEPEPDNLESALADIMASLSDCRRCGLHSGRHNLVFGEGSAHSGLVFVGEGPGFEEDQQGRPFVGRAGRLLDKMIQAIGLERQDVFICNVVKCRPPQNRTPAPDEIAACSPFLFRQLEVLKPKVICALGVSAARTILGNERPISSLRGKVHIWRGYPLVCTYHPAYLLRSSQQKAAAWQDLKEVCELLASSR